MQIAWAPTLLSTSMSFTALCSSIPASCLGFHSLLRTLLEQYPTKLHPNLNQHPHLVLPPLLNHRILTGVSFQLQFLLAGPHHLFQAYPSLYMQALVPCSQMTRKMILVKKTLQNIVCLLLIFSLFRSFIQTSFISRLN